MTLQSTFVYDTFMVPSTGIGSGHLTWDSVPSQGRQAKQ